MGINTLLITTLALTAVAGVYMMTDTYTSADDQFANFVSTYRKSYFSKDEFNFRKTNFVQTLALIAERNSEDTATHGITHFADMSQEEFETTMLTYKSTRGVHPEDDVAYTVEVASDHTKETTPVKD